MVTNGIEDFSTFFLDGRTLQKKHSPIPQMLSKQGSWEIPLILLCSVSSSRPKLLHQAQKRLGKFFTEKLGHAAKEFHDTGTDQFKLLIT